MGIQFFYLFQAIEVMQTFITREKVVDIGRVNYIWILQSLLIYFNLLRMVVVRTIVEDAMVVELFALYVAQNDIVIWQSLLIENIVKNKF